MSRIYADRIHVSVVVRMYTDRIYVSVERGGRRASVVREWLETEAYRVRGSPARL